MKYNSIVTCKVCGKTCLVKDARVEWLQDVNNNFNPINIHLCHKKCSVGYNSAKAMVGDFDLNSPIYNDELVFERLNEMKTQYPYLLSSIDEILSNLFDNIID